MRTWNRFVFAVGVLAALALTAQMSFAEELWLTDSAVDGVNADVDLDSEGYFLNSEVDLAKFQQPETARPSPATRRPTRRAVPGQETARPTSEDIGDYLASAPRMFGHYYGASGQLLVRSLDGQGKIDTMVTDLPIGGGGSPLQITDNNTPVPQSRFFFNYNHYENALRTRSGNQQLFLGVDQYTMGIEQSFMDGISSWQL